MFCTNCGAKVDEDAKFCAVCGNKLDRDVKSPSPSEPADTITKEENEHISQKSTYEPITSNENQIIEDKPDEKAKESTNKFSEFLDSFKSIKPGKKKDQKEAKIEVPEGKSELSKEDPVESLNQRLVYEDELHPTYYGYDIKDERKDKNLRHKQDPNYKPADKANDLEENNNIKSSQTFESDGSNEVKDQSQLSASSYTNIPNEHLEARIARQFQKDRVDKNQRTANTGNVAAMIRANQPADYYNESYRPTENANNIKNQEPKQELEKTMAAPPPPASEQVANDKKGFKFNPLYLIPLVLLLIGLAVGYWWINRAPEQVEVDLSEYIDVTFSGDDGAASPSASINSSKLLADYGADVAYTNKSRKDEQYSSPANQFISELESSTEFNFSKDNNISNGEEVIVSANISDSSLSDDYNVLFTNTIKSVIAEGLITQEYVDPFAYINVDFEGESPNISLVTSLTEDAPEYMQMVEIAPSKTSELSEGEEVNVSIIYDEENLQNNFGLLINPTDKTYVVPGPVEGEETEEEPAEEETDQEAMAEGFITSVDNLNEDLLGTLKYNAGQLIKDTFEQRSFTQIGNIEYLGAITGSDTNSTDLINRVMLIYEITANENYESKYTNDFTYYTFVEYQNVSETKDADGKFYTEGPMTTDNEIFHKFFVEDDYTYYEIPYYGFGFLEEVLSRVNNALSGLTIDDSIAVDASGYFVTSDGLAGEYQGNNTRLTLKEDGTLRYKLDQRVHQGSWQESTDGLSLTIEGVNVDTPITATFENGAINVPEQGEVSGQTFNKMSVTG